MVFVGQVVLKLFLRFIFWFEAFIEETLSLSCIIMPLSLFVANIFVAMLLCCIDINVYLLHKPYPLSSLSSLSYVLTLDHTLAWLKFL